MHIYALRDLAAGEELFYDYGLVIDARYTKKLKAEYACRCGSPSAGAPCWRRRTRSKGGRGRSQAVPGASQGTRMTKRIAGVPSVSAAGTSSMRMVP